MLPAVIAIALSRFGRQSGTEQLVAKAGQTAAELNGAAVQFKSAPLQIAGHTMVPIGETLSLFGLAIGQTGTTDSVARLTFDTALTQATYNGSPLPIDGNFVRKGDAIYVRASLLAEVVGGKLTAGDHGEFYITVVRVAEGDPNLPQPRFVTDRDVYDIGQPVNIEQFSFDPVGGPILEHWTNREPAYFKAGPQTITLEVDNPQGHGNRLSRTIVITDHVMNTPLQFALKYAPIGDTMEDDTIALPVLPRQDPSADAIPLLFSDSPEQAEGTGALFRTRVTGRFRLVGYHINATSNVARVCVAVKNVDSEPGTFRTERIGDTAPERIEGVLGQVMLMAFLTDRNPAQYRLGPGESALIYLSPPLASKEGASVLADLNGDRRFEVTVAMTVGQDPLSPDAVASLSPLEPDRVHDRGIFPSATRRFALDLGGGLPAKAVIGDSLEDPLEEGQDPLTQATQKLNGNYGLTYDISLKHARGVVGALAPRGGPYKGTIVVEDISTGRRDIVRVPREGVLFDPVKPMIFMKSTSDDIRLEFIPASGSHLPVSLAFYRQ